MNDCVFWEEISLPRPSGFSVGMTVNLDFDRLGQGFRLRLS
jgi:hypothetical protein